MIHTKPVTKAAKAFFDLIAPESWDLEKSWRARGLVLAAFALYAEDWSPANIERWEWPARTFADGKPFNGDEPWTILLRRALELTGHAPLPLAVTVQGGLVQDAVSHDPRWARAAKKAGWVHGGDAGGFWFHLETWGSWKAAASWVGTDQEPPKKGKIYATAREVCEEEEITP